MPAEWLLKSFGVRFTVQRFTTWLETIRDSVDIFRQPGEYTVEEREKSLTRADAVIDDCVNAVEVGLADNFRAIGGHDPRDWFATTLTTAKKLRLRLRTLHDVLSERPDAWLTETQQKELESLGSELRERANLLDSAASTLPADDSIGKKDRKTPPTLSAIPSHFIRNADPQSVTLLEHLLKVGPTTRKELSGTFFPKPIQIGSVGKALNRLDEDLLAYADDAYRLVLGSRGAVRVDQPNQNGTESD